MCVSDSDGTPVSSSKPLYLQRTSLVVHRVLELSMSTKVQNTLQRAQLTTNTVECCRWQDILDAEFLGGQLSSFFCIL